MGTIETKSKLHSTEPMTSRYLPDDFAKMDAMSKMLGLKRAVVPVVCVRLMYPLFKLFSTPYFKIVMGEVHRNFVHDEGEAVHNVHKDVK